MKRTSRVLVFAIAGFVCAAAGSAQDYSHIRIVRLSFVEGQVRYQRPGQPWEDAKLNLPIEQGFALGTDDGFAEVEFEHGLSLRLANDSSAEFTELALEDGRRITKLNLSGGTAIVTADLAKGEEFSLGASNVRVSLDHKASFRVDTSGSESWITVLHGKVSVESGAGAQIVGGGHTLHENAEDLASSTIEKSPARDSFDKWVSQREEALSGARADSSSVLNVASYTAGFADLDLYGGWAAVPGYGLCWQPYGMGASWMPFLAGQWMFMGNTGWNWVSAEPWGWFPYHFGSWVVAPGMGWMWVPRGALSWQPATAAWVQANNQLGWSPTLATPIKPTKTPTTALRALILPSGSTAPGSINAGRVVDLTPQGAASARIVSGPAPGVVISSGQSRQTALQRPNVLTNPVQSLERGGPRSLAAPRISSPTFNSSVRPMAQAPRSSPVPRAMYSRGARFFGGGGYVMRGSGPSAQARGASVGSAPSAAGHSGGGATAASHR